MMRRAISIALALALAVFTAVHLSVFFEVDACADAGGRYLAETGACEVPPGVSYVPQYSRPNLYAFWIIFLLLVAAPAWFVLRVSRWLTRRARDKAVNVRVEGQ